MRNKLRFASLLVAAALAFGSIAGPAFASENMVNEVLPLEAPEFDSTEMPEDGTETDTACYSQETETIIPEVVEENSDSCDYDSMESSNTDSDSEEAISDEILDSDQTIEETEPGGNEEIADKGDTEMTVAEDEDSTVVENEEPSHAEDSDSEPTDDTEYGNSGETYKEDDISYETSEDTEVVEDGLSSGQSDDKEDNSSSLQGYEGDTNNADVTLNENHEGLNDALDPEEEEVHFSDDDNSPLEGEARSLDEEELTDFVEEDSKAGSVPTDNDIKLVPSISMELLSGGEKEYSLKNDELIETAVSSDTSIVTVTNYEDCIVLLGKRPGNARIRVTGEKGTPASLNIKVLSFLNKDSVTVEAESTQKVRIRDVRDSFGDGYSGYYSAVSSNKAVATVAVDYDDYSEDEFLVIEGREPGNVVITARNTLTNSISRVTVEVVKPSFKLNKTTVKLNASLTYTLKASGSEIKKVECSNPKVLTAEQKDSQSVFLRPVKPGSATVTVTNYFGSVQKANVTVTSFLKMKKVTITAGKEKYIYPDELFNVDDYWYWNKKALSSNSKAATAWFDKDYIVYDEEALIIGGKYPGKTTLTIKCGKTGAGCPLVVTVRAPSFNISASKLTITDENSCMITASGSGIDKAASSNTSIIKAEVISKRKAKLIPVKPGKATVSFTSRYGVTRKIAVTVSNSYFKNILASKTKPETPVYGTTILKGKTAPSSTVSVSIQGKTFTAKADSNGSYTIKGIPVLKVGTRLTLVFKLQGFSISKVVTIGKGKSTVYTPYYTYMYTTQVPVEVVNVHSGDQIKIAFDGKVYTRTFSGSYNKITVKVDIKKPNKYGIKMAVKLKNKFGQDLAIYYDYIYISNVVHVGDTKAKVRWLADWNDPVGKEYTAYGETWEYDWDGDDYTDAYLYFDADGKVTDWLIFD